MDEIRLALEQPRLSLSPSIFSEKKFRDFKRADAHASKERQVTTGVILIIEGDVGDRKRVAGEIPFTNLDHLTDGSLVPGNPDVYYGARPEQLDRQVRTDLNHLIVPSTQQDLPVAPNFFMAVKGPDGSSAVAQRQACYDRALGARGMQSLRSYRESDPVYDNRADTVTCTYHAGTLKMYTSHLIQPAQPGARLEYAMTQIKAFALTSDADTFRQAAAAYRNGRDWAKRQADEAIRQANERAVVTGFGTSPPADDLTQIFATDTSADDTVGHASQEALTHDSNALPSFYESDTSADELSQDFAPSVKRPKGLPEAFQKKYTRSIRSKSSFGDDAASSASQARQSPTK